MTGPLNWYKDGTQLSIDESMSLLHHCCSPSHTDNPSETFPGIPPTLQVLLIYGKYDPTSLEFSLKLMKFLASVGVIKARFEELDAWHWLMHKRTDEVTKLSLGFLKEVLA